MVSAVMPVAYILGRGITLNDDGHVIGDDGHVWRLIGSDVGVWVGGEHLVAGNAGKGGRSPSEEEQKATQFSGYLGPAAEIRYKKGLDPFEVSERSKFDEAWGSAKDVHERWRRRVGLDAQTAGTAF